MEEKEFRERLIQILGSIDFKLGGLEDELRNYVKTSPKTVKKRKVRLDVDRLLSLPNHLRRTAIVVDTKRSATAEQVASETGLTRAAESDYLNQLVGMGYLHKRREGRTVYFYV